MDLLIRKGVPLWVVLKIIGYTLPFIFSFTVPMAALVATLVAFGRMAQNQEILALKALGVSVRRAAAGPLIGASLLALFLFWFNNWVVPEANHRLKATLFEVGRKKPTAQIKPKLFTRIEDFLIYVEEKDDRTSEIFGVKIEDLRHTPPRTVLAERGRLAWSGDTALLFFLKNGEVHEPAGREGYRVIGFEEYTLKIPVNPELAESERRYRTYKERLLPRLLKDIRERREKLKEAPDPGARKALRVSLARLEAELWKRFVLPVAAVVLILVGVPIAVMTRRGGYGTAFGVSFFIFVLYYIMLVGGEELSRRGFVPSWSLWAPNLFFLIVGFALLRREER